MSQWPPTQLSEGGRPLTAETLLRDVKHLIEQPEFSLEYTANRDPYTDKTKQFAELVGSLSDMLSLFPKVEGGASKNEMDHAMDLAHLSLDAIERISARMEGVLAGDERSLTGRLLMCVSTVDEWVGKGGPNEKLGNLRERILQVLARGFRHRIEETFTTNQKFEDGILVVKACIREAVSSVHCKYCKEQVPMAESG